MSISMKRSGYDGSTILLPLKLAVFLSLMLMVHSGPAQHSRPAAGFTALFNGKDRKGWHGMEHIDPRTLWGMTDEERARKRAADTGQFNKHWRVENAELVNDG